MKTNYEGIDYGCGQANYDTKNNIRYGVISINEVLQAWADSAEPHYIYTCPYCGADLKKGIDAKRCPACYKKIDSDYDFDMLEPVSWFLDDGEYMAEQRQDDPDIFIVKSPYYTYAQFCSPCAPGACYLLSPLDHKADNNRCYCFGHDFFESGKAPYKVYSVETGEEITP